MWILSICSHNSSGGSSCSASMLNTQTVSCENISWVWFLSTQTKRLSSVTYHLFLKTSHFRCRVSCECWRQRGHSTLVLRWPHCTPLLVVTSLSYNAKTGWVWRLNYLSVALLGVNEDVHTLQGYIVPAIGCLNFTRSWRSR